MSSPYDGVPEDQWRPVTEDLLRAHPLDTTEVIEVVLGCWDAILRTRIGNKVLIGVHIFPRPQVMGSFLHELIPLEFNDRYPHLWRRDGSIDEKDMVYIPDPNLSVEIKTSSSASKIFGNRSYAQPTRSSKKSKSGYYLAINFEKFERSKKPGVTKIHFGWLDEEDWIGQSAQTGQQSRLPKHIYGSKLLQIYSVADTA